MKQILIINNFTLNVNRTPTGAYLYWFDNGIDVTEYMDKYDVHEIINHPIGDVLKNIKELFDEE